MCLRVVRRMTLAITSLLRRLTLALTSLVISTLGDIKSDSHVWLLEIQNLVLLVAVTFERHLFALFFIFDEARVLLISLS